MSAKINVLSVIKGHVGTLVDHESGKTSVGDHFTFFGLPLGAAVASAFFGLKWEEGHASLLVTAGALFTGLLLSLLILVYDQQTKVGIPESVDWQKKALRKEILRQLYLNISYSTLVALALVLASMALFSLHSTSLSVDLPRLNPFNLSVSRFIVGPVVVFLGANLFFTVIMVIKRINSLLTTLD
jgi:hypothetical protein